MEKLFSLWFNSICRTKGKALFRIPSSVPTEITRLFTTKEEKIKVVIGGYFLQRGVHERTHTFYTTYKGFPVTANQKSATFVDSREVQTLHINYLLLLGLWMINEKTMVVTDCQIPLVVISIL